MTANLYLAMNSTIDRKTELALLKLKLLNRRMTYLFLKMKKTENR